jgi:hypothetical protein
LLSDYQLGAANDALLMDRQQPVDRQLGEHVDCEVVCEHERFGAAIRAARKDAKGTPLFVRQLCVIGSIGKLKQRLAMREPPR